MTTTAQALASFDAARVATVLAARIAFDHLEAVAMNAAHDLEVAADRFALDHPTTWTEANAEFVVTPHGQMLVADYRAAQQAWLNAWERAPRSLQRDRSPRIERVVRTWAGE